VDRGPGLSVRLKLTVSYAGFLMLAGVLLLGAVWMFLLRYVPDRALLVNEGTPIGGPFPIRSNLLHVFAPKAAIVLAILLVVGLVGGWILSGRMLAPLTRITDATRIAANGSLSHRIRLPGPNDEFRELADAFDTMLARLEAHSAEQQRFAANASHELRTPLAITQTLLDVARNDPNRASSELDDRLRAVNARAIDLTEALLLLSRADQRSFTPERVDLSLIAEEATETLLPLAEGRCVTIETSGDVTPTIGSKPLLLQLTTNLLHNAIVHNLPERGTVWVTTSVHANAVVLTVENTGEQLPPQLVSTFVEPFQRGTERTHTDHAGVGLGLAIAKSVTQAHEGTLTLTPRATGGLCVTVQLPGRHLAPTNFGTRSISGRPVPRLHRQRRVASSTGYPSYQHISGLRRQIPARCPRVHMQRLISAVAVLISAQRFTSPTSPTSSQIRLTHNAMVA
jgi:two-component system, OmpR family, sensor histidine kinase VanS